MSTADHLRGSCSCGRYNYIVQIPGNASARNQAHVHFGTGGLDREPKYPGDSAVCKADNIDRSIACLALVGMAESAVDVVSICHGLLLSRRTARSHSTNIYSTSATVMPEEVLWVLRNTYLLLD